MENIKVKKEELLKVLKENRAKHREIFLEALEGFRKKAITEFEKRLEAAKAGKHFDIAIALTLPQDQTKDYDRAIGMLELAFENFVQLAEPEYPQYFMTHCLWNHNFLPSNS